jgi:parallel beta-helix repeat protein
VDDGDGGSEAVRVVANDVTLSRLDVNTNQESGIYVGGNHVTVENCIVRGNAGAGIRVFGYDYTTLQNNTVSGNGGYQIWLDDSMNSVVENNIVWANGTGGHAVALWFRALGAEQDGENAIDSFFLEDSVEFARPV